MFVRFDGRLLRQARLAAGFTQENLARTIDVTLRTVQRWEESLTQPKGSQLMALANVLGVQPDSLFEPEPEPAEAA